MTKTKGHRQDMEAVGAGGVMYGPRDAGGVMYGPQDAGV